MDHCGKTYKNRCAFSFFLKKFSPGILGNGFIPDCAVSFKITVGAGTPSVDDPFGDTFPIEVRNLFKEVIILQGRRATVTDCTHVLVIGHRVALAGCQRVMTVVFQWIGPPLMQSRNRVSAPSRHYSPWTPFGCRVHDTIADGRRPGE